MTVNKEKSVTHRGYPQYTHTHAPFFLTVHAVFLIKQRLGSQRSPLLLCALRTVWTRPAAARGDETLMTFRRSCRIARIPRTDALSAPAVEEAGPKPVQEAPSLKILVSPDSLDSQSSVDELLFF